MAGDDWVAFLAELGVTQEQMDAAAKTMPQPLREEGAIYYLDNSSLDGLGVFAKQDVNGFIGWMRDGEEWYVAGRYTNHSPTPNAIPIRFEDKLGIYGDVKKGEEITLNYRDVRKLIEHS